MEQRRVTKTHIRSILIRLSLIYSISLFGISLIFYPGCITTHSLNNDTVLSTVNNEPITFGELKQGLQGLHLQNRKEKPTGLIDIHGFLDKLINRRLLIQEAQRMGFGEREEVSLAENKELKRQAIIRLYQEEIEDKVTVSDEETWSEYENMSQENIQEIEFEQIKASLKKGIRKERIKEREDGYLHELLEKAEITVNKDYLSAEGKDPHTPVALVNNQAILLGEIEEGLALENIPPEEIQSLKEKRLNYMIECLVVDQEALSRGYEKRPEIQKRLKEVRENSQIKLLLDEVLIPSIHIDEAQIRDYYDNHPQIFTTPVLVKMEEIKVSTLTEAEEIAQGLKKGADFAFLTNRSLKSRIKSNQWVDISTFPTTLKEALMKREEGAIVGPVPNQEFYSLFLIKRRTGGEKIPFEKARPEALNKLWQERYEKALIEWEAQLRGSSRITIYKDRLKTLIESL